MICTVLMKYFKPSKMTLPARRTWPLHNWQFLRIVRLGDLILRRMPCIAGDSHVMWKKCGGSAEGSGLFVLWVVFRYLQIEGFLLQVYGWAIGEFAGLLLGRVSLLGLEMLLGPGSGLLGGLAGVFSSRMCWTVSPMLVFLGTHNRPRVKKTAKKLPLQST